MQDRFLNSLSGAELRARLINHGTPEDVAMLLVDFRERDWAEKLIMQWLNFDRQLIEIIED
jgi:hypothetical protein